MFKKHSKSIRYKNWMPSKSVLKTEWKRERREYRTLMTDHMAGWWGRSSGAFMSRYSLLLYDCMGISLSFSNVLYLSFVYYYLYSLFGFTTKSQRDNCTHRQCCWHLGIWKSLLLFEMKLQMFHINLQIFHLIRNI